MARLLTYGGIFLAASAMLMVEILLTRITSVIAPYHLAFFVIALAMLGMTAGAILVFLAADYFRDDQVGRRMTQSALAFAIAVPLAFASIMSRPLQPVDSLMEFVALLGYGVVAAVPFVLIGVTLTLALTRAGLPPGLAYGADLCGAAAGCWLIVPVLDWTDGPSAALLASTLAAVAAACLGAAEHLRPPNADHPGRQRRLKITGATIAVLALLTWWNHSSDPHLLRPAWSRGRQQVPADFSYVGWNTHSRVTVAKTRVRRPAFWGRGQNIPKKLMRRLPSRRILIDGGAATRIHNFQGDLKRAAFIEYELAAFAYRLRQNGASAIIGVGGGRDVLAAAHAGHNPIVGIEINSRIVELHKKRMRHFSGLTAIPGVQLVTDEARSYLTRDSRRYDVIIMSLIDTWAASGAGAYSLTENSLYTVEAWVTFFHRLKPNGIFTVSRWFGWKAGETVRMLALAVDSLWEIGAKRPRDHLVVLTRQGIATLLASPQPFSEADLDRVESEARRLGFNLLLSPRRDPPEPTLVKLLALHDHADLVAWARTQQLDVAPPTDDRPFFFNMLPLSSWMVDEVSFRDKDVTIKGNLQATKTLAHAILASVLLTVLALLWPLWNRRAEIREVPRSRVVAASAYFALIGLGFMFVEIGLLSRLNVFLGQPVLALAVALGGLIMATGLGSLASSWVPVDRLWWGRLYPLIPAATTLVAFQLAEPVMNAYAGSGTAARIIASLALITPPGLAMGLGFPLGLRLVQAHNREGAVDITPWLWGINGAFGVCASGFALATSMTWGISRSFAFGTLCYGVLLVCTWVLACPSTSSTTAGSPVSSAEG